MEKLANRGQATAFDAIAIGASAGGVTALRAIVETLSSTLAAALFIVLHLDRERPSVLAEILGRHAHMIVKQAVHGEPVVAGTAYVAPPDHHLLVERGHVRLTGSPAVCFSRPSVDLLLTSLAEAYGPRAIGVVLTGYGTDGTNGVRAVRAAGGVTLVQDPAEAEHASMPQSAYATGCVDARVKLAEIGPLLEQLVTGGREQAMAGRCG